MLHHTRSVITVANTRPIGCFLIGHGREKKACRNYFAWWNSCLFCQLTKLKYFDRNSLCSMLYIYLELCQNIWSWRNSCWNRNISISIPGPDLFVWHKLNPNFLTKQLKVRVNKINKWRQILFCIFSTRYYLL